MRTRWWRHGGRVLQQRLEEAHERSLQLPRRVRADFRLVPAVAAMWLAALGSVRLHPVTALWCGVAVLLATVAAAVAVRGLQGKSMAAVPARASGQYRRSVLLRILPTILLAAACMAVVMLAAGIRVQSMSTSPLAQAAAQGADMAMTIEIVGIPQTTRAGHGPVRVFMDAAIVSATSGGKLLKGRLDVRLIAGPEWASLAPGDMAETAGVVSPTDPGERTRGLLRPRTVPQQLRAAPQPATAGAGRLRTAWKEASNRAWGSVSADAAALLPGMVAGDRSGVDAELGDAMKTVGLTHLTAVSGANCTLVLAGLLILLRSAHAPAPLAAAASVAGLVGFVAVVGPDASVLRAAVMGGIGVMAMMGGRPGRTGAMLSVSVLVLLAADPWLAVDFAFILSVLATLGLHLVGRRCAGWLAAFMPWWLAQAVAIPLAAQLFCGPVIVLLQARLTPYTIPANMLAAPVVALVTTVGTVGMVVAAVLPALGWACAAVSGVGAWWVAAVAKVMSALPAASLPWPEGALGAALMAAFHAVLLAALVVLVERVRAEQALRAFLLRLPPSVRRHAGLAAVLAAALLSGLWTAALVLA